MYHSREFLLPIDKLFKLGILFREPHSFNEVRVTGPQTDVLVSRMLKTLSDGRIIVIVGWIARFHDDFTETLDESQVRFYEKTPISYPQRSGLVLLTKSVGQTGIEKARKETDHVHRIKLTPNEICKLLGACREQLKKKEKVKNRGDGWIENYVHPVAVPPAPAPTPQLSEEEVEAIKNLISLKPRVMERKAELEIEVEAMKETLARIEKALKEHPELAPPQE